MAIHESTPESIIDTFKNKKKEEFDRWLRIVRSSPLTSYYPNPYETGMDTIAPTATKIEHLEKPTLTSSQEIKNNYTIDECLICYNELIKKELSEPICIGGSVGLYLQGIIKRDSFHDMDLVFTRIPELDDDIEDYKGNRGSYYKVKDKKDLPKSVIFEGILIDMFVDELIQKVSIKYKDKEYICQDYKQILNAKLRMCLESFKDYDDIVGKHININIT